MNEISFSTIFTNYDYRRFYTPMCNYINSYFETVPYWGILQTFLLKSPLYESSPTNRLAHWVAQFSSETIWLYKYLFYWLLKLNFITIVFAFSCSTVGAWHDSIGNCLKMRAKTEVGTLLNILQATILRYLCGRYIKDASSHMLDKRRYISIGKKRGLSCETLKLTKWKHVPCT